MNIYNHIAEMSHVENKMSKMNLPETVPALCIAKVPVLQAFRGISHFVWYCRIASNELQMV